MRCESGIPWLAAIVIATASVAPMAQADETNGTRSWTLRFPVSTIGGEPLAFNLAETPAEVRYSLEGDVLFDFDKAAIREEARTSLEILSEQITTRFGDSAIRLRIEGHTDAKGDDAYNQGLSERRAEAVATWLKRFGGFDDAEVRVRGFGETRPVAPNAYADGSDFPEGRQLNRRVEIVVEKTG